MEKGNTYSVEVAREGSMTVSLSLDELISSSLTYRPRPFVHFFFVDDFAALYEHFLCSVDFPLFVQLDGD